MRCPHSLPGDPHELEVPPHAENNARTYDKSVNTVTDCCGEMVRIRPVTRLEVNRSSLLDQMTEDDWGRKPRRTTQINDRPET